MKYIYINDLSYFIKYEKKLFITYVLFAMAYLTLNIIRFSGLEEMIVIETLALECKFDLNEWLNLIAFITYISIHCYICLKLFIKDFKNNPSNIFLRISSKRWILYKMVCISVISIILLLTTYMVTILPYVILVDKNCGIDIILFIKNYVYISILQQIVIVLYTVFSKYNFIIMLIISAIIIKIFDITTRITYMNIYILIAIYIAMISIILMLNRKLYINLFEKEE